MPVGPLAWHFTIGLIVVLLLVDYFFHVRKAHVPSLREAGLWSAVYIGIALLFGVAVLAFGGAELGAQYFAGYLTEKALSVDNVFVFLFILSRFKVPRQDQQKALLFGIVVSLIVRTAVILVGAALISRFSWVFYLFGLLLLVTAGHLLKPESTDEDRPDDLVVRLARNLFGTTDEYDGDRLFTIRGGRRMFTPMVPVIVSLGGTDLLFAMDSIPAIFGLTQNLFIVFTATAFSLLGLRQLFFLIDGLLERLLYLGYGLAMILAFIGVKLILHALNENALPFINGGAPVRVVEITTVQSLVVIVAILVVTVYASLKSPKGKAKTAVSALRRHCADYLEFGDCADPGERERAYARLVASERQVSNLEGKFKALIREPEKLKEQVDRARQQHSLYGSTGSKHDRERSVSAFAPEARP
jgi:tellurite resistance protein TerC